MKRLALLAVLAAPALAGCYSAHLAVNDYNAGMYEEVLLESSYVSKDGTDLSPKRRVIFYVYRGLARYRLWQAHDKGGDAALAAADLRAGLAVYDKHDDPTFLTPAALKEARAALADLDKGKP